MAPVIPTQCQLGWAYWMLGYPDQAKLAMHRALALADQLKRPFNTAFALQYGVALDDFLRDYRSIQRKIEVLTEISRENGFMAWIDSANLSRGRVLIFEGEQAGGIAMMLQAISELLEHGSETIRTLSLPLLADSLLRSGEIDKGLATIEAAFAQFVVTGIRIQEAETYRLKGELLFKQNQSSVEESESCFRKAIEIARKQTAKSWELRAAMSLARLLASQGRRDEARTMLSSIYDWFTEGFGTADLKDAKSLLGELSV
jgi:predicted ATPase